MEYDKGDLVWFDPGVGYVLPGEVTEFHRAGQVVTVQAVVNGKPQVFTLTNLANLRKRQDLGQNGVDDMIAIGDLNEASILWNLKLRYDKEMIYTYTGSILVSVNPYRMFDIYGLDMVKRYEDQILGSLPPHIFAIASSAYSRMTKEREQQTVVISGESGAGKTEATKLIMQYLAAVNKSPSNLITEQILEATPLLESFGNAKTMRNDNSSRFGKYLEVYFKEGIITGARTTEYLLEKSRIVTHAQEERNYHVFYEMLAGLGEEDKKKYGLLSAEQYFYLNQGGSVEIDGKYDKEDFQALLSAMQVLGFSSDEQDNIFKILASVLHLGNIYFHRAPLKHGQEGVEIGSDAEVRWLGHLLGIETDWVRRALMTKTTEARNERVVTPLNIDQALDARDAISKVLYSSLFSWLVRRINQIVYKGSRKMSISILDIFGFEDFKENSLEQLCINYANETLQYHFSKHIFKLEQQEYLKEKIEWQSIAFQDNWPVLHLISKKPVGIFHLLDDESNFPKATDVSLLEKLHYNHALDELYSRPRMSSMEFGVHHYAGQVWYNVDGFLDKNRDILRNDVLDLLVSSDVPMISEMFVEHRAHNEAAKAANKSNGRFVTMKPRTPTVAARFHESLTQLLESMTKCNPWFIRCVKPNAEKAAMKFDMPVVLEQLRYTGMLDTIRIRQLGYPVRLRFAQFADRYRGLLPERLPRGTPARDVARMILESNPESREEYQLGTTKVFLREGFEQLLERRRLRVQGDAAIKIQKNVRRYLAEKRYRNTRQSAVKVQSYYRMYRDRKRYRTVRAGMVKAQANFRMQRQRRRFGEMKGEMKRRVAAERAARARAKTSADRPGGERGPSRAVAGVNHLEIPAELAFIFSRLDDWHPAHSDRNLMKIGAQVDPPEERFSLPHDIDYHAFTKFTNIYFKAHLWGMKREPIRTPFLAKSKEADYQQSLAIFKLVLRFMNDNNLSDTREKALGDYIVNKGLTNEKLRDEILCQLCNQTWKNDNEANAERGWLLMSNCLSVFPPSDTLYKYLLKYVSDHGQNGYAADCQKKLLRSPPDGRLSRVYPPTLLEWRCNRKKQQMALEVSCSDGHTCFAPVDSWTTGEELAAYVLENRGIGSTFGWTAQMTDEGDLYELSGNDYVMDVIGETELPPGFPAGRGGFMVSERTRGGSRKVTPMMSQDFIDAPRNGSPQRSPGGRISYQPLRQQLREEQRRTSAHSGPYTDDVSNGRNKSRSLDNLLDDGERSRSAQHTRPEHLGLSASRLNERYHSADVIADPAAAAGWNKHGLSESALNDRYFVPKGTKMVPSPAGHDVIRSEEKFEKKLKKDRRYSADTNNSYRKHEAYNRTDEFGDPVDGPDSFGAMEDAHSFGDEGDPAMSPRTGSRYVKSQNAGKRTGQSSFSSRAYIESRHTSEKEYGVRSSAMSDTSEAPSLASHVRRVRVPSQASDMDQFVDALFMPVLEGNLDELSDARSLAASIKGGGGGRQPEQSTLMGEARLADDSTTAAGEGSVSDAESELEELSSSVDFFRCRQDSIRRRALVTQQQLDLEDTCGPVSPTLEALTDPSAMVQLIKGGAEPENATANQQQGQFVFQPIAGSGMMSPPPMMMPGGMPYFSPQAPFFAAPTSPEPLNQSFGDQRVTSPDGREGTTSPVQVQYVPVPVYGMSGFSLPNMSMYGPAGMGQNSDGSAATSNAPDQQQMASYQRMFIQSAVAQNMQIQQQLFSQNQALAQLLQATSAQDYQPSPGQAPGSSPAAREGGSGEPSPAGQQERRRSATSQERSGIPPAPPMGMTPEEMAAFMDPSYTRARTVRIGKWRWPPPKGEMAGSADFMQFKLQAQHRKMSSGQKPPGGRSGNDSSFEGVEWDEFEMGSPDDTAQASTSEVLNKSRESAKSVDRELGKPKESPPAKANHSAPNSISKLKISSALKMKLEAVTSKHSERSSGSEAGKDRPDGKEQKVVKKLDASRRMLLQKQLGSQTHLAEPTNRPEERPRPGVPPPPPPIGPLQVDIPPHRPASPEGSSFSDSSSPVVADRRSPPRPIQPIRGDRRHQRTSRIELDRKSNASETTHVTEKTERYELEESEGFLRPVDSYHDLRSGRELEDERTLESAKTRLFPPSAAPFVTYNNVSWRLDVRKEVFSPTEDVTNATALHLVFCQIVHDVYNPACIRISQPERQAARKRLDELGVSPNTIQAAQLKLAIKRQILEMAREWPTYFCMLFPVSGGRNNPLVQFLGVSHSGVRLLRREKGVPNDFLKVIDHVPFEEIATASERRGSSVQLVLKGGARQAFHTSKAGTLTDILERFIAESQSGSHEYVRATADYTSHDPSLLSFMKGDLIRVIKKSQETEKGWLFGLLDGRQGTFPSQFVVPVGKNTSRSQSKISLTNGTGHVGPGAESPESHDLWSERPLDGERLEAESDSETSNHSPAAGGDKPPGPAPDDGKHSLLQYAMLHFRDAEEKYNMLRSEDGEITGSMKLESKKKGKKKGKEDWTWREQVEMVKWTNQPLQASLLKLESGEMNKLALECFLSIQRYMGDQAMGKNMAEVDCVYTILMACHRFPPLRDEVFCQLMRQTTSNKSNQPDSCQRGWRLFSIVAAYFACSDGLRPYLFKYLETAAYDKRRAYHGTAMVCLQNLRKTFRFGGRKNVPSIEEITAITAGRNSKRQIYRLPGGTERVINTKSTSVVQDIIEDICSVIKIRSRDEMEEFSLYCIVEGDTFTMPLAREEYILDVTTELQKNEQIFYLIFCRSVWYFPLRLESPLYVEVVFNQIAPDYLEGLLLVMPGETLHEEVVYDISRVAALLHRAADMQAMPTMKETKYLLPKAALMVRDIKPPQWVNMVQGSWTEVQEKTPMEAKAAVLEILERWPLFGSSFFAVSRVTESREAVDHILALNRGGVHFLDSVTHETLARYPFSEVISTRKVKTEEGTLFLDMKYGNLMQQKVVRIQSDNAHEISRLIRQYISIEQKHRPTNGGTEEAREGQASR
ncbi:unconventional myosin-XV-like isoform X2 [Pollicipes pollicipes]|uniref:unconventional myosin-XV-like isoform X2 n=1 Tax=Pollicipes pollicipes TaxID=41117 RepID=UPI0018856699|nr:unconventional myosin-XV-like isoform X2 [Pollicipes pollicipes]